MFPLARAKPVRGICRRDLNRNSGVWPPQSPIRLTLYSSPTVPAPDRGALEPPGNARQGIYTHEAGKERGRRCEAAGSRRAAMIRAVLCDLSGVLYVGDRPVPGAVDALVSLRAAGVGVRFITNVTRLPRRRIVEKLSRLGFEIDAEDVFTPSAAARTYVTQESLVPHLLIHPNLQEELGDLAGPAPNAVLVGDAGHAFTYENLNAAFRVLIRGAPLLAMGTNRYYRESDGLSLDLGPFVKALTYASGAPTVVLGKPSSAFFRLAAASLGVDLEDVVMVGDDYEVDVRGALDAGLQAILVRTGKYRDGDECRVGAKGTRVCADIGEATDLIL